MNLLFVTTQTEWGGSEPLWAETAKRAAAEGHRVTAVFPHSAQPHDGYNKLREAGVEFISRPARMEPTLLRRIGWKLQGLGKPEVEWWRRRFARTPDAVCVSQGGSYCALTMPGLVEWLRESPMPYILVSHSHRARALPESKYITRLQRLFRGASAIGFVAKANRAAAEEFLGLKLPQANILQNPLNLKTIESVPWPEKASPLRLACVGRIDFEDKGQDLLVDSLAQYQWKPRDFTLDIYGSGPDESALQERIDRQGLTDKVRLAGFERDVRNIWADHQVLVMPSRSEGTPISLIEAQICARPAVVTDVDGNGDWVEDGKTGFVAKEASVEAISDALERMWSRRDQLRAIGEAARQACLAKRDPDPEGTLLALLLSAAAVGR
jgi:glycosyltransferase involved in cell wall biosynthesis